MIFVVVSAVVLAGCAAPAKAPTAAGPARETAVYLSVLRHFFTSGDTSFGDHQFPHVFMRDVAVKSPIEGPSETGTPIPTDVQGALTSGLADLAPLEFVHTDTEVIEEHDGCAQVRDGGILITLGPVAATGDKVEVDVEGFVACLGAVWLTYVVRHEHGRWVIADTIGRGIA